MRHDYSTLILLRSILKRAKSHEEKGVFDALLIAIDEEEQDRRDFDEQQRRDGVTYDDEGRRQVADLRAAKETLLAKRPPKKTPRTDLI